MDEHPILNKVVAYLAYFFVGMVLIALILLVAVGIVGLAHLL